ncbi:MAG: hypothetical protein ACE5GV_00330 [Candidatus Scalindua sp.]
MSIKEELEDLITDVVKDETDASLEQFQQTLSCIIHSCIIDITEDGHERVRLLKTAQEACWFIKVILKDKRKDHKKNKC